MKLSTNFPRKKRQVKIFPSEKQESYALKKWADYHPICKKALLHIKNGGSLKSKIEGANFKRAGVKAGVSDYLSSAFLKKILTFIFVRNINNLR